MCAVPRPRVSRVDRGALGTGLSGDRGRSERLWSDAPELESRALFGRRGTLRGERGGRPASLDALRGQVPRRRQWTSAPLDVLVRWTSAPRTVLAPGGAPWEALVPGGALPTAGRLGVAGMCAPFCRHDRLLQAQMRLTSGSRDFDDADSAVADAVCRSEAPRAEPNRMPDTGTGRIAGAAPRTCGSRALSIARAAGSRRGRPGPMEVPPIPAANPPSLQTRQRSM